MRPITDDVVLGLMKGLEKREKRALRKRAVVKPKKGVSSGRMTSRVFDFVGNSHRAKRLTSDAQTIAAFKTAVKARKTTRTTRGLFSYLSES